MKLDGQVGLLQSHAKDFVLYSKWESIDFPMKRNREKMVEWNGRQ